MKKTVFTFLQWTWGLPQTLIGSAVYIANRKNAHFDYNGASVTVWDRDDGLSLGKFIFIPRIKRPAQNTTDEGVNADEAEIARQKEITEHEFGHSIQSLILGPAYLILIGAPSMLWNRLPYFVKKRKKTGKSYYSPIFERTANKLGCKRKYLE